MEYEIYNNKNILHGPKFKSTLPNGGIGCFILDKCMEYSEKIIQICPYEDTSMSFKDFKKLTQNLAVNMQNIYNPNAGDVIMCCMQNSLMNAIPTATSLYLNCIICHLDPKLSLRDLIYHINIAKPKLLFVDYEYLSVIEAAVLDIQFNIQLIVNSDKTNTIRNGKLLRDLLIEPQYGTTFASFKICNEDSPAAILFSSGTTGLPKGILLSHKALYYSTILFCTALNEPSCFLHFTSLYWISGLCMSLLPFLNGSTRVALRECEPKFTLQTISQCNVNALFMTTYLTYKLFDMKKLEGLYTLASLRNIVAGGSPMTKPLATQLRETFPDVSFTTGYGMTEIGFISGIFKDFNTKYVKNPETVGTVAPGTSLKIVDVQTGEALGPNELGEIHVKSVQQMISYCEEIDHNPYDEDGFIKTGDIGHFDENYFLYIHDRIKDMFKYKMHRIVPASIEVVIKSHPAVEEAVVFGIPDKEGHLPAAAVKLKRSEKYISEEQIGQYVSDNVADYQKLRGGLFIIDNIDRTPSGKVQRRKVQIRILESFK